MSMTIRCRCRWMQWMSMSMDDDRCRCRWMSMPMSMNRCRSDVTVDVDVDQIVLFAEARAVQRLFQDSGSGSCDAANAPKLGHSRTSDVRVHHHRLLLIHRGFALCLRVDAPASIGWRAVDAVVGSHLIQSPRAWTWMRWRARTSTGPRAPGSTASPPASMRCATCGDLSASGRP